MTKPRAFTKEEVKNKLLNHMRGLVEYWSTVENKTDKEKLSGLAFSTLVIFDGETMDLPAIDLILRPHPSDKKFHQTEGDNWYKDGMVINDDCHLHELWHKK